MGNNVASQQVVGLLRVRGRLFRIERIAWTNSDGLSFDVYDEPTGQCLTATSRDQQPGASDIEDLLDGLAEDLAWGTLDHFFEPEQQTLAEILRATRSGGAHECQGHESLAGESMGETVYCDGSCRS